VDRFKRENEGLTSRKTPHKVASMTAILKKIAGFFLGFFYDKPVPKGSLCARCQDAPATTWFLRKPACQYCVDEALEQRQW